MKASQFSDAQKAFVIKQGDEGAPVDEICRKAGISQATNFSTGERSMRACCCRSPSPPSCHATARLRGKIRTLLEHARDRRSPGVPLQAREILEEWIHDVSDMSIHRFTAVCCVPKLHQAERLIAPAPAASRRLI